jgi:hypothetical protein
MEFCRTLSLLSHLCLVGILGKENFECGEIERFRNELSSVPPTYDFVWKVTATSPPTKSPEAGTKERGIIMDALHHTMMDYEYRQMWMSLMRHNYTLFMSELKEKGHTVFIKPKYKKRDDTFEGNCCLWANHLLSGRTDRYT